MGSIFNPENNLKCPVCGEENNHISSVEQVDGQDHYRAGWDGRGDLIILRYKCEQSHVWEYCIGFHKGHNYVFKRAIFPE
jgi:hypothetical protein